MISIMKRPSHKEITNKILQAKKSVQKDNLLFINPNVLASDALELGYLFGEEIKEILTDILNKAGPDNYVGLKPPQKSYEQKIYGSELFAFRVKSDILNEIIYFKFVLANNNLYLISLHKHRATTK